MALHKFTPGGCRQNCDTSGCCPDAICAGTVSHTFYTLRVYRDAVLVATYTLPKADVDFGTTVGCGFTSAEAGPGVCGLTESWALLLIQKNGSNVQYSIVINDVPYGTLGPYTYLSVSGIVIGTAPVNCGQTLSGTFDYVAAPCGVHAWTYEVEPGGTLCTAAASNSCCPCENCQVFRDPFNRAPGTDMGSSWSEVAGDWTLTAYGTARIESANAQLISTSAASQVGVKLMSMVRADASGDILRLILSYADADNYLFAEWKCGSNGYLRIYERDTATDTLLDEVDTATAANYFTLLTVCVNDSGTSLTAVVSQGVSAPAFVSGELASTAVAGKYGLATGATCSGASFGRIELVKTSPGCEACASDCDLCTDSTPEFVVDLGATPWVTDPDTCCQAIHGEFTVAAIPKSAIPSWVYSVTGTSCDLWPVYDTCYWAYNDSSCNLWVIARVGTATTGLHWAVDVHVVIGTQTTHRKWVYSKRLGLTSSPLDCAAGWTVDNFCGGGITGVGECVGGTASPPSSVTVAPP